MAYRHPDPDSGKRLILALDVPLAEAKDLIRKLANIVAYFKIGVRQIHAHDDEELVDRVHECGGAVFLDGKVKDIPNTVSDAVNGIVAGQVELFNVYCEGGIPMMQAAMKTARETAEEQADRASVLSALFGRPLVIGVTVLTSISYDNLAEIGLAPTINGSNQPEINDEKVKFMERLVVNLALGAKKAGLDGVVASPLEAPMIRQACGPNFHIITPGIRASDAKPEDQKRTRTAAEAIAGGSDFLVVGRPIYAAKDPVAAALKLNEEVARALTA